MSTVPMVLPGSADARVTDPDTSHEARDSITATKAAASCEEVLRILRTHGPLTDEQISGHHRAQWIVEFSDSRLRTARHELVEAGHVVDAGEGLTRSGRRCKKWAIAPE